ncbi:heparin lyase I family protein [candidate division KSB1 bacterium]|nr:heparin lyase I family protein [candidate division KSB1 bacterium]
MSFHPVLNNRFNHTGMYILVMFFFCVIVYLGCSYQVMRNPSDDPDILARVNFDHHTAGQWYGHVDVKRDFGTLKSWGTWWPYRRVRIAQSDDPHDKVLQVRYPESKVRFFSSGASWHWKPFQPRQELFFSYWLMFPDSLEFRYGGKLHGLVGGKANTGGDKPNGHDGWSCRVHWGPDDLIKLYIYHKDQKLEWGDVFYFRENPGITRVDSETRETHREEENIKIEKGKWHHIMMRLKVNDIGQKNGLAQAWYDGKLVADIRGFEFRDETCKADELLVNGMYFSTFYGGRDERYKPVKDEYILFDDFILSKSIQCPAGLICDPVPD